MKKMLYTIIGLLYLMQIFFIIGGTYKKDFNWPFYVAIAVSIIIIILSLIYILKTLTSNSNNLINFKETRNIKFILIPYFIINFVIGLLLALGSLVLIYFLPFMVVILILMICFTYLIVFTTSIANIKVMFLNRSKDPYYYLVQILLHFIFVLDVISAALVYNKNKSIIVVELIQ